MPVEREIDKQMGLGTRKEVDEKIDRGGSGWLRKSGKSKREKMSN